MHNTEISASHIRKAIDLGMGTSAWGDRVVWQFGREYDVTDLRQAFDAAVADGIRLIDTAEIYGSGRSEGFVGEFLRGAEGIGIATKYFPWPWRIGTKSVIRALRGSLRRLGVDRVDLYQIHWPSPLVTPEVMAEGLADCVESGFAAAVGISNFAEAEMLRVYSALARRNIPLASNQVHFSLLHRQPESSGLLKRCKELDVRLIAYSPLEMGLLTGKYGHGHSPPGSRGFRYAGMVGKLEPLLQLMTDIGQEQGGKTNAQVALNWLMSKGAIPIPGAKNAEQAHENAGARGWNLTNDQMEALDASSAQVS